MNILHLLLFGNTILIIIATVILQVILRISPDKFHQLAIKVSDFINVPENRRERLEREFARKSFHLMGLTIPLIMFFGISSTLIPKSLFLMIFGSITALTITAEVIRFIIPGFNTFFCSTFSSLMRDGEEHKVTGTPALVSGVFLTAALYPPLIAVLAMSFLFLGDWAAALVGISKGTVKLVGKKTLQGFMGCLCVCMMLGTGLLGLGGFSGRAAVLVGLGGAFTAAFGELLSGEIIPIDDNFLVPVLSGFSMTLMCMIMEINVSKNTF
eukprot:gnl/Dysnectes_brevis/5957_a8896_414.p1 GENE.gnl/Dysnectes_brevis/5957_a8896_414~~gnl/Dysnectes_brevis/5957_a8896_414.p1  ORF type:complete len:277 (+),score=41.97 gnl/Dysnectes_brevis/5957_a8896_414:27-833(+)